MERQQSDWYRVVRRGASDGQAFFQPKRWIALERLFVLLVFMVGVPWLAAQELPGNATDPYQRSPHSLPGRVTDEEAMSEETSATRPAVRASSPHIPLPALESLVKLRAIFGNPFAGTCLESEDVSDRQFELALRKASEEREGVRGRGCSTNAHGIAFQGFSAPDLQGENGLVGDPQRALRRIARQLDRLAADLEDFEQYADADELRDLATRLRHRVRFVDRAAEAAAQEAAIRALRHALRQE